MAGLAQVRPADMDIAGGGVLLNGQTNYGGATASVSAATDLLPLNAPGAISASRMLILGNTAAASAYGNSASNSLSLVEPAARNAKRGGSWAEDDPKGARGGAPSPSKKIFALGADIGDAVRPVLGAPVVTTVTTLHRSAWRALGIREIETGT